MIYSDEMGLGKSLQALVTIAIITLEKKSEFHKNNKKNHENKKIEKIDRRENYQVRENSNNFSKNNSKKIEIEGNCSQKKLNNFNVISLVAARKFRLFHIFISYLLF